MMAKKIASAAAVRSGRGPGSGSSGQHRPRRRSPAGPGRGRQRRGSSPRAAGRSRAGIRRVARGQFSRVADTRRTRSRPACRGVPLTCTGSGVVRASVWVAPWLLGCFAAVRTWRDHAGRSRQPREEALRYLARTRSDAPVPSWTIASSIGRGRVTGQSVCKPDFNL